MLRNHRVANQLLRVFCAALILSPSAAMGTAPDLAQKTPSDILIYAGWSGHDQTKVAAEDTAIGKTLAEPQVKRFVDLLLDSIDQTVKKQALDPNTAPLYDPIKRILSTFHRRPTALVVLDLEMSPMGPLPSLAIISHVKEAGAALIEDLGTLLQGVGLPPAMEQPMGDGTMYQLMLPIPGGAYYALVEGHFVLAVGRETMATVAQQLAGEGQSLAQSESLTLSRKKIGGTDETRALSVYVNATKIRELVEMMLPMFTGGDPAAAEAYHSFLDRSGFGAIRSVCWEMHHRNGGCCKSAYIHTEGKPAGWLGFHGVSPLTDQELSMIPREVRWAFASRLASTSLYDDLRSFVISLNPEEKGNIEELEAEIHEALGIHLGRDFLDLIGDTVIVFDAPEDGGFLVTGITVAFKTSDSTKFGQSLRTIVEEIAEETKGEFDVSVAALDHRAHRIEFVNAVGAPVPVAPAWAAHNDWMIVGLYPQVVRNTINRLLDANPKTDSILANPDFVRGRKHIGPLGASLSFMDSKSGAEEGYSVVLPLAQTGLAIWQGEGGSLNVGALPSRTALTKHLFSDLSNARCDSQGMLYTSYGPLPFPVPALGSNGSAGTTAMLVSVLLPSLARARELSKRLVSQSNMRGIVTSCTIYANDHDGQWPPNLQTLVDEGAFTADMLKSPKHQRGRDCYVYIAGQTEAGDYRNVVLYERRELNDGEGVNVAFLDGHVEFMRLPEFEAALAATKARLEAQ